MTDQPVCECLLEVANPEGLIRCGEPAVARVAGSWRCARHRDLNAEEAGAPAEEPSR